MGRYQLALRDDEDDENDSLDRMGHTSSHSWELIASSSERVENNHRIPREAMDAARSNSSGGGVHHNYYVFVQPPSAQDELDVHGRSFKARSSSWKRWFWSCLWICSVFGIPFVSWCIREGPPGPPLLLWPKTNLEETPDAELHPFRHTMVSWRDFWERHSAQLYESIMALGYHTPLHLLHWYWKTLVGDVETIYKSARTRFGEFWSSSSTTKCPPLTKMELSRAWQQHFEDSNDERRLSEGPVLIGQPHAVETMSQSLSAWSASSHSNPLVLYLTGHPSTGKVTLVNLVAELTFDNCGNSTSLHRPQTAATQSKAQQRVLVLSGRDFANKHRDESLKWHLQHLILRHLDHKMANSSGVESSAAISIVHIQNVDEMDPELLKWLLRQLSADDDDHQHADPELEQAKESSGRESLRSRCRNTLFFLTSAKVGTKSIANALRRGGSPSLGQPHFMLDAEYEINSHFGWHHGNIDASHLIDSIVPFVPLMQKDLFTILRHRVHKLFNSEENTKLWKSFHVTDAAVESLLDPARVEYLSWSLQMTDSPSSPDPAVLTFSTSGAAMLGDKGSVMSKIRAHVYHCMLEQPSEMEMEDDEEASAREPRIAVLDVSRSLLYPDRGVLKWCDSDTFSDGNLETESCEQVCDFAL